MVFSALEVLSITANAISILAAASTAIVMLIKNILLKRAKVLYSADDNARIADVYNLVKLSSICGIIFQFLAWVMFSANQSGFIKLSNLTYAFAVSWAATGLLTLVMTLICKLLNKKKDAAIGLKKSVPWLIFISVLYFIITFFIG